MPLLAVRLAGVARVAVARAGDAPVPFDFAAELGTVARCALSLAALPDAEAFFDVAEARLEGAAFFAVEALAAVFFVAEGFVAVAFLAVELCAAVFFVAVELVARVLLVAELLAAVFFAVVFLAVELELLAVVLVLAAALLAVVEADLVVPVFFAAELFAVEAFVLAALFAAAVRFVAAGLPADDLELLGVVAFFAVPVDLRVDAPRDREVELLRSSAITRAQP